MGAMGGLRSGPAPGGGTSLIVDRATRVSYSPWAGRQQPMGEICDPLVTFRFARATLRNRQGGRWQGQGICV